MINDCKTPANFQMKCDHPSRMALVASADEQIAKHGAQPDFGSRVGLKSPTSATRKP